MSILNPSVQSAVDDLYSTFAQYRLHSFEPCPDCYPADEVARIGKRLRTVPLRSLTLDDLGHFYSDGVLTWGDVDDFRHLLPRLMELLAALYLEAPCGWTDMRFLEVDPDIAMLRFVDAEWRSWPAPERDAVEGYLLSLWSAYLSDSDPVALPPGWWLNVDLLKAILRTVPRPDPYLDAWRATDWRGARMLAWYISTDAMSSWLRWESDSRPSTMENWSRVYEWLWAPATVDQLERAARDAPADIGWELIRGLETFSRGKDAVKWTRGTWYPDKTSVARAASLGVDLTLIPRDVGRE